MGGVGVDGLVEREVGGGVVEGFVQGGHGGGEGVGETGHPLLEETLALSSGDGGAGTLVVVEGLRDVSRRLGGKYDHVAYQIIVVLEVDEVLLGEQGAEGRVSKGISLISAELEHVDNVGRGEVECTRDLGVEAGEGAVESIVSESSSDSGSDGATAGNVGVWADAVGGTRVVHIVRLKIVQSQLCLQ